MGTDVRWHVGFALGVLVLCAIPGVVADRFGPAHLEGLGTFWFGRDFSQYQAAMRDGASSASWLIPDHFTAEPHAPAFSFTAV